MIITIIINIVNEMMMTVMMIVMEERNENKTSKHSLFFQEKNPRVEQRKKKLFDQILFLSFGQIYNLDYVEPYSSLIVCKVTYSNRHSSYYLRID